MDRIARPQDDLFENSTMTFGEHLEELRKCLVHAVAWLAGGLIIGLFFADSVILFIQQPLESAIRNFQADRDLYKLGYDPKADESQPIRDFMTEHSLVAEVIYTVPEEYQSLTSDSIQVNSQNQETAAAEVTVDPSDLAKLLSSLPTTDSLKPVVQFRESSTGLSSLKVEEPFMVWVKAGLIVGAVFSSPMVFYHLWSFIAAGLHSHERRYVYIYLPVSVVLFVSGVVLAFFLVLHYVLSFLLAFNGSMDVAVEPRLTYYVNFVLMLPLGFGIAFQLPIVMLFLQRIGLLETQAYVDSWKIAVLVIFVISMIVTPADVTSMVALAIPLVFLYMLGILMCKFIPQGRGLGSDAYDPA
ncbi:twin-arginine translocase subunit TatC [Rubripirellula amarantea]|uniref:Sec-independent protein translocase protein TatC n=1 Tax=Rubripirellula amarantea TaxID=2527999 RepID=A0A5C5WQG7_9BACT|nr:twin-arginine translocase subunit TatC [Rubripirellula amarantea]MDA8743652.1 twin-arginine translocase subunit TatC [Rubripirellula amarantea]TWT52399.1 Sec-independent protein translocase protein TatCy [Rubripirellula amarantea]